MTDFDEFERRLSAAIRSDADASVGSFTPESIARAAIADTGSGATRARRSSRPGGRFGRGRGMTFLAAGALLLIGGALAGSGILRLPSVVPPAPAPSFGLVATASPHATSPSPRGSAGPSASPLPAAGPGGAWIATGTMGTPRGVINSCRSNGCSSVLHAVRLLDGRVLVMGGSGEWFDPPTAELYDPDSGTWSATGSMLKAQDQDGFLPTLLLDGRVLVRDVDGAELYDPVSGTWSATGKMITAETDTATLLLDGMVLVSGQSGTQVYDPESGSWSATGQMITPRHYHTATLLRDGKVLVVGGYDRFIAGAGGDHPLGSAELYDPDTGSWTAVASMHFGPSDCVGCGGGGGWAALLQDGTLLLIRPRGSDEFDAEIYDPATGTWTKLAEEGPGFAYGTPTLLSDGTVLVTQVAFQAPCNAARYDPRSGSWTSASSMLRCVRGSSFTLLLDGTVLVAGGEECNERVDAVTGEHRNLCGSTSAAVLFVPRGVSPPPLPAFPSPPPPVIPSPTPVPTPLPPAAGPVPPNGRSWKVTVDNKSSEPATLFVAEPDAHGMLKLVGSATPNVVPAGATVKVTFLFPANVVPDDGWIFVNPRPGDDGGLVGAADIGIPGKILIGKDGQVGWLSPPGY
jgi:hypothetical protein